MNTLQCTIASVDTVVFRGEAHSVEIPTADGVITILPHHEPMVGTTSKGTIRVETAEGEKVFDIKEGGIIEVLPKEVSILL